MQLKSSLKHGQLGPETATSGCGAISDRSTALIAEGRSLCDLANPAEGEDAPPIALGELLDVVVGEGHGIAVGLVHGDLAVGERWHGRLAGHGRLDIRRQLLTLGPLPVGLALSELGHDLGREQLEALTNMIVAILAALLDEDRLVDASILEGAERPAQLVRRADAVGASAEHLGADLIAHGLERRPDVRAPGFVLAEDVVVSESELEETEAIGAPAPGFLCIAMAREACDHGDVRVHRVADGHTLALEGLVVVVDPGLGFGGIDKRESQRADAELRGQVDGLAIGAGHPDRWVGLLHRLGYHIARGHREELALEAR